MGTEIIIDGIKNVHFVKKLKEHAWNRPDKIAVRGMGEAYTYRQLDQITDVIGEDLLKKGLPVGSLVAVNHERHLNVIMAAIGCWKARVGYFYIDTNMPDYQKQQRLEDSNCQFIIDATYVEDMKEKALSGYEVSELPDGDLDDLAWILYTSGSSGKAKGVCLKHSNIAVHMNIANVLGTTEDDTQSMMASFSFMSGLLEGFPILYKGGTLSMVPNDYRRDIKKIIEFFREEKVSVSFVPSHYAELIASEEHELPDQKVLFTGGEAVHNLKKMPFHLYCVYGSSECGGPVTCCKIDYSSENYPIGTPIPMVHMYLVKEDTEELITEPGEIGEICISSVQVCDGYLNRPELNAVKFFENPFTDDPNYKKVYRTGDLGKMDEEGNIYYAGRADLMCKIKSFRIELGTVEAEMIKYPGIDRCVVKPFVDCNGAKELHGFYYGKEEVDHNKLRDFLRDSLNHYMVPPYFHRLDTIQVTDNGKVDRKAVKLEGYSELL